MNDLQFRGRFRFSLMDVFVGLTCLAIGFGGLVGIVTWRLPNLILAPMLGFISGAAIGAGILSPFRKKAVGAALGFVLIIPMLWLVDFLLSLFWS
jgi:hypothetical protein